MTASWHQSGVILTGGGLRFFLATLRHVRVRQTGSGRVWCLYCETEREYVRRAWTSTRTVVFLPVAGRRGEFVLCRACECAFDPECLDESSTALCEELLVDVPDAAIRARLRPRPDLSLAEYLDQPD